MRMRIKESERSMVNEPIRIAQVIGKANLSGVDTVVMEYYRHINRERIQFDFIIDGYDETPVDEEILQLGGCIYKVAPYEQNVFESVNQWSKIFKENRYQMVHAHLNTLNVFPLYAAWRAGVPVRITHNHSTAASGEGKKTKMKYVLRLLARLFATHYCACSAFAGKWLFGESFYDSGKVRLIKNAIDIEKFSYNEQVRNRIRREFHLDGKLVVGHVGRFVYQKNHDFLIDIFSEIHKENADAVLVMVGSGELEQEIRQKAESFGLTGSALFLGIRNNVNDILQAMDVFLFPSHYEGLGMAVIEAQAAGLLTIVSEAVPREAKITDLMEYCNLSQPASVWAEKVLALIKAGSYERQTQNEELEQAGYDIIEEANRLQGWYEAVSIKQNI
ncbi:glycosyltransferase [Desulfitobacterium dehalogenans ATCC 51507]|uniref:Glycosyltransferase n=1 Tax=Desulfitobacterium dehalogenans (strain ATCC 51507 / DSM 9161 / JW/IU-DC1) TaxID=756499 RepID=I4ADS6_DESDJ|nr:glycosyltransferase family 1 protein [Desulfitobacterium dehalogenans]AFM02111.1 glycosyltransferase [Desulfitobacterium dehalogenans ATCC 51507]